MNTIAERIYLFLKSNKINVFFPGQHKGHCESPYVVVKQRNTDQVTNFSSNVTYFSLLCYVPDISYSKSQEFANEIENLMIGMQPEVMPVNSKDEPFHDEDVNAYMISIMYRNYSKQK